MQSLNLIDTRNSRDAVHCCLELAHRMDCEVDGTYSDIICSFGTQASHGQMQLLSNALHEIAQEVVSVYCSDTYPDRIELLPALKVHSDN